MSRLLLILIGIWVIQFKICYAGTVSEIVAVVGSETITMSELQKVVGTSNICLQDICVKSALNRLIEEKIVRHVAKQNKIVIPDEQINQIFNIVKQRFDKKKFQKILQEKGLTVDDVKARCEYALIKMYLIGKHILPKVMITQEMFDKFCEEYAIKVHAKHILVKTEEEAKRLLQMLKDGAEFSKIAEKYSLCPSRMRGGDLGFFGRGQMVREFEDAAYSLTKEKPLSDVVKTKFGYHIILFVDKRQGTKEAINKIKKDLITQLTSQSFVVLGEGLDVEIHKPLEERFIGRMLTTEYNQWLGEMKKRYKVRYLIDKKKEDNKKHTIIKLEKDKEVKIQK